MTRRFLTLTVKDLKLLVRNHHLTIVVAVAILYALLVRFLIPGELSFEPNLVVWDQTAHGIVGRLYAEHARDSVVLVGSEKDYLAALETGNRIGLKVTGQELPAAIEVTFQGFESPRIRRVLEASLRAQVAAMLGQPTGFPTTSLRSADVKQPPFNLAMVPVLVLFEAVFLGMLLAAVLLYSEKEEQTLRAYRVSPGGIPEYLLARSVAMGLLGLVSAVVLTLLTVGAGINWPVVLAVVFLGSLVITLVTMVVANMFHGISQFFVAELILMVVLSLPLVSYFQPGLSLAPLRLLPTYPLVFALREAYFPTGSPAVMTTAVLQLLVTLGLAFPLAVLSFRRQLVVRDV